MRTVRQTLEPSIGIGSSLRILLGDVVYGPCVEHNNARCRFINGYCTTYQHIYLDERNRTEPIYCWASSAQRERTEAMSSSIGEFWSTKWLLGG